MSSETRKRLKISACVVCSLVAAGVGLMVGLIPEWNKTSKEHPLHVEQPAPTNTAPSSAVAPWPHDESDIPLDPKVRVGTLDNGLRYMIMPFDNPPNKLSLRLHVDAGSLMEAEDQRGLAHFLEHMLFNGSRNYEAGELVPIMQRLGIKFGSHANAYTTFDETVYILDLPDTEEAIVDLGFTVMRDYADGALLDPEEIEKERGVVLSEKNARDSISNRLLQQKLKLYLPDSLLTYRFPIGTEEVISTAPRERFLDFYTRYYIPQRITFIASGDMEADDIEARIIETFETMVNPENPGQEPDLGTVPKGKGFRTAVFVDEEIITDTLEIFAVRDFKQEPDTVETRIAKFPLAVAQFILSSRFRAKARKSNSPVKTGRVSTGPVGGAVEFGSISVYPEDGRWEEAVMVLEQEFRRALKYGFTQSELDQTKAIDLSGHEALVENASRRKAPKLAAQLANTVNSHTVFSTPEEDLRIAEKAYARMTLQQVNDAFSSHWETMDIGLNLITNEAPENAESMLARLYAESQAVEVAPLNSNVPYSTVPFAYTDFGSAGSIVSDTMQEDLEIRQLVLSNNVRVNLKQTDFEENSIALTARFGSGRVGQPKDQAGLDLLTSTVMNNGGLGKHSRVELGQMFVGKSIGLKFYMDNGGFDFAGSTTPDDVELQLQYMVASMLDPGYSEGAVHSFRKNIPDILAQLKYTMTGASMQLNAWLKGGDGRFAVPTEEGLTSLDIDQVTDWIQPQLNSSYLEVSIVGDFDMETIIPLVLETFGAMPMRDDAPAVTGLTLLDGFYPQSPTTRVFTYVSKLPKAAAVVLWKIPPLKDSNIDEIRQLVVLNSILSDRMFNQIREELGATYSPSADVGADEAFYYGAIMGSAVTLPEDVATVGERMISIGKSLAQDGATEDEFLRAMEPHAVTLDSSLRSNGYWLLTVMQQCQAKPFKLDWSRNRDAMYEAMTLDGINQLATKYLGEENAIRVEVLPVNGGEEQGEVVTKEEDIADSLVVTSRSGLLRGPAIHFDP